MKAARGFKRGAFGFVGVLSLAVLATRCQKTGKLSPDLTARFEKEGIVHRPMISLFAGRLWKESGMEAGTRGGPQSSSHPKVFISM